MCKLSLGHTGLISLTVSKTTLMGAMICSSSQLEQIKTWANIRDAKKEQSGLKCRLSRSLWSSWGTTAGGKTGATSFPGQNLDWKTQTGPIEEGERGEDRDTEDIFTECLVNNIPTLYILIWYTSMHCSYSPGTVDCNAAGQDSINITYLKYRCL